LLPVVAMADARSADRAEAFERLITPLLDGAFALACAMLRDRQSAEDAVQEAAVSAWRHVLEIDARGNPRAWFLKIVANQCRDTRRSRWWRVVRTDTLPERSAPDHSTRVAEWVDLDEAMALLTTEQRALLLLRYRLDLPVPEIARVLSLPPGTVKSRLHRTLQGLRSQLAPGPREESR
jgi:RNA polymerase sigma-70 factor (ECF subfamily)